MAATKEIEGKKIAGQLKRNKSEALKGLFGMARQNTTSNKLLLECNSFVAKMEI